MNLTRYFEIKKEIEFIYICKTGRTTPIRGRPGNGNYAWFVYQQLFQKDNVLPAEEIVDKMIQEGVLKG